MVNVAIIILNWNKPDLTINAVKTLQWDSNIIAKVIVADNNSDEDCIEKLSTLSGIDILQLDQNYGYAQGYNIAVDYVLEKYDPQYLFLLNNDTLSKAYTLDKLYEKRDEADILCPKIYAEDGKTIWACGGNISLWRAFAKNRGQGEIDVGQYDITTDADFISGCAMWMKSQVVRKIGLFDPVYRFYYEDVDFCERAKKKGYSLKYIPSSEIIHLTGQSIGNEYSSTQSYFRWRNRIIFANKNIAVMPRLIFIVILLPFILVRDTYRYLKNGLGKELFAAYKGLWSIINVCSRPNDK